MRRIAVIVSAVALGAPAVAQADQEIVAAPPYRYVDTDVTIDQGEPLTFRNTDAASHDVQGKGPDGAVIFKSEIIGQNETSFVEGSQYLATGTYDFFCSLHPSMVGKLNVTAAGTPAPRPGTGSGPGPGAPAADTQEPAVALELRRYRAAKVRRSRRIALLVGADEAAKLRVTVSLGGRRAARRNLELETAGTRTIALTLARTVRTRIRRGAKLTVLVRAVDAAGNAGSDKRRVTLR